MGEALADKAAQRDLRARVHARVCARVCAHMCVCVHNVLVQIRVCYA